MTDTIEKIKHKPIMDMMTEFEKFYVIALWFDDYPVTVYFVDFLKNGHFDITEHMYEAKMFSQKDADEMVMQIKKLADDTPGSTVARDCNVKKILVNNE